jgi:hypothetical protein
LLEEKRHLSIQTLGTDSSTYITSISAKN